MARFGRPKNINCFYCGKRAAFKFDGSIREFLCLKCDATNYLDQNGEITDPPVATEREAPPTQYITQTSARQSSAPDSVFCETCLKNQRLFTASLAQYLPDDPNHPDYAELDRNYYKYRRSLEKRYPQVCEECDERVQQRIKQAGYTARTDHLRRMMDRTRGRKVTKTSSSLDWVNSIGRSLWIAGLLTQLLWHLVHISAALEHQSDGMYDPDDSSTYTKTIVALRNAVALLPDQDFLIRTSITAGILCVWWNPHFVQVNRGFTRHILGLTQWYSFQCLIIFFRILSRGVSSIEAGDTRPKSAQIAIHAVTSAVMCLMYVLASRSVKIDMTPLFKTEETTPLRRKKMSPEKRKEDDSKTFSELFSEALHSTPTKHNTITANSSPIQPFASNSPFNSHSPNGFQTSFSDPTLLNSQPQAPQYEDEMDWSPSHTSPYRALQSSPQRPQTRGSFGEAPTQPNGNTFWYKVPPAPTNPAQRHRNPPNKPTLRKKMASEDVFFSSAMKQNTSSNVAVDRADVTFKNPSFFAKQENDEASSLADLLGQSFSLSQDDSNDAVRKKDKPSFWSTSKSSSGQKPAARGNLKLVALLVSLLAWLAVSFIQLPYELHVQVTVLVVAGAIALSSTSDGNSHPTAKAESGPILADIMLAVLGVIELGISCWLGWQLWSGRQDISIHGMVLLGGMIIHQTWKAAKA